jgi:hypothetical protein
MHEGIVRCRPDTPLIVFQCADNERETGGIPGSGQSLYGIKPYSGAVRPEIVRPPDSLISGHRTFPVSPGNTGRNRLRIPVCICSRDPECSRPGIHCPLRRFVRESQFVPEAFCKEAPEERERQRVAGREEIGRYLLADCIDKDEDLPVAVAAGVTEQGFAS